jgi:hypothetical protein
MHRIANGGQVLVMPAPPEPTGAPGYYVNCDAGTQTGGTPADAFHFNAMQEELVAVATMMGAPLNRANNAQVKEALEAFVASKTVDATQAVKGVLKLATAALAQGWADDTAALTAWSLSQAFKGANQMLAPAGYQKFPGGVILQWCAYSQDTQGQNFNFPIEFPNACLNVIAQDNAAASASVHALACGTFTKTSFNVYARRVSDGADAVCASFRAWALGN